MSFRALLSFETLAAVLGTALVTLLVDVAHLSPYWLLIALPVLSLVIGYSLARKRLTALQSGVVAYVGRFAVPDGRAFWTAATDDCAYWGVTGASIVEEVKAFLHAEPTRSARYRFLLMSGSGRALREQVAFKMGLPRTGWSAEQRTAIEDEVAVDQQRLQATLAVLKSTPPFRESPKRLEIRLYDEFLPSWMYLLDGSRLVVGILRSGRDSADQPAALLTKKTAGITLFESFQENFERVWRSAQPA